ncbi:MAG: hypothetical protein OXH86_17805 [Acidimicrobiaceae bacterium]|nr:hypothetical protein [Acidimicrobiaceae bacterium]MDE0499197.1 hypothetical protein [Acidimicrobiaceae bacterium]
MLDRLGARWAVIVAQADGWRGRTSDPVYEVRRAANVLWPSLRVHWPNLDADGPERLVPVQVDVLDGLPASGQIRTALLPVPAVTADVHDEDRLVGRIVCETAARGECCDRSGDTVDALVETWQLRASSPHRGAVRRDRCD